MRTRTLALAVALVAASTVLATARAHEDRHEPRRERGGAGPPIDPIYAKECGACHLPYPPGLLPAASWRRILGNLSDHFGDVADLEPEVRSGLERWLVARAARPNGAAAAPPRITASPWFVHEHREVPPGVAARPAIGSFANCGACHPGAGRWDFDDDRVNIPPG